MSKYILCMMILATCEVTERARIRAHAENKLEACLFEYGTNPMYVRQCLEESARYCREHGLENSCGADNLYTIRKP